MTPTQLRDRAMHLAKADPDAALRLAREVPAPWFRAQALAAVARWIAAPNVETTAAEALSAASACHDDYQRAAVAAWPIRALLERGHVDSAAAALAVARARALAATPCGSRAEALLDLLQAAWSLGAEARRTLVEDLCTAHEQDSFWRVTRALADALAMVRATEPDLTERILARLPESPARARIERALARHAARTPRSYFA